MTSMDILPPSKFNLDDWKRYYSNNEVRPTSCNYFWQNFDKEGYSMYRILYNYNDELSKIFMSNNLIGGFFQRLDHLRKYMFGSMCVFGEDDNNIVQGMFIIRGLVIPEELNGVVGFDSYTLEKVDPDTPETRAEWESYIAWDGEVSGKKFADGKIFK